MKKILVIALAAMMALFLAACGGEGATTSPTVEPQTTSEAPADPTSTVEPTDDATEPTDSAEPTDDATGAGANLPDTSAYDGRFTEAYAGVSAAGEAVYYAGNDDGSEALLMYFNPTEMSHYAFVGPIVDNGDGTVTITDEKDGLTMTFGITAGDDGVLTIDMGDELGTAVLAAADVDTVLLAILAVEANTNSAN